MKPTDGAATTQPTPEHGEAPMRDRLSIENLTSRIGMEIHVSEWISVTQAEIDSFGRVTRDIDPMHMDPAYAGSHGPFGKTVLYGFQTLSMLTHLSRPVRAVATEPSGDYDLNYGLNRVRFVAPIPVDTPFRNHVVVKDLHRRDDGRYLLTTINTIEVKGSERPALVAEWIGLMARDSTEA
jgi:acyl dehydratase